jgi:nitroreductase
MNDFLRTITERRSIRKYTEEQVTDEVLEQILYAASFSPNAGNRQTTQIVVCQDKEVNDRLGRIKKSLSHVKISSPGNYISTDQPSIADDPTLPSAFYGAPTVITLFGPKNFWFKAADCYIMANNICLAAYSLALVPALSVLWRTSSTTISATKYCENGRSLRTLKQWFISRSAIRKMASLHKAPQICKSNCDSG